MADAILAEIRASKKKFYVYILSKPDGTPFYVGLGRGSRIQKHEWRARTTTKNCHRLNIIRQILRDGLEVGKRIDSWHEDLESASAREIELIGEIGREDLGTGPLVNLTSGGNFTWKIGEAGKAAASRLTKEQFKNPERREKQRRALRQYFSNPEALAAMSERMSAGMTTELRKKIGKSRRQFNIDNPLLASLNDTARLAALRQPSVRKKMAAATRDRLKANPDRQPAMVAASRSTEARERNRQAQIKRFSRPEEIAKSRAAAKKWKSERTKIIERCQSLLESLGLVVPSGKASIADWRRFEDRLLSIAKESSHG